MPITLNQHEVLDQRCSIPPYDRLTPENEPVFNHKDIVQDLSRKWQNFSDLPRFGLESSKSFEVLDSPRNVEANRECLRINVRRLNDIRHSNSGSNNDKNNGLVVQARSSLPACLASVMI